MACGRCPAYSVHRATSVVWLPIPMLPHSWTAIESNRRSGNVLYLIPTRVRSHMHLVGEGDVRLHAAYRFEWPLEL